MEENQESNSNIIEEIMNSIDNRDLSVITKYNRLGLTLNGVQNGAVPIIYAYDTKFHDAWKLIIDGGTTIDVFDEYIDGINLDIFLYFVKKGMDPRSKINGIPIIMRAHKDVISHYLSIKEMDIFDVTTDDNLSIMGYLRMVKREFLPYVTYDDLKILYEVLNEKEIDFLLANRFSLNERILFNTNVNRRDYIRRLPIKKNLGIPVRNEEEMLSFYNAGYDFGPLDIIWLIKNESDIELMRSMVKYAKNPNLKNMSIIGGEIDVIDFVLEHGGTTPQSTIEEAAKSNDIDLLKVCLKHGMRVNESDEFETSIHVAANRGHTNVIKLLIETGHNVTMKNIRGRTPLDMAKTPEMIRLLKTS